MNFKEYLDRLKQRSINEAQMDLQSMLDNYRKVFPYSDKEARVLNYRVEGQDTQDMTCRGVVASETDPGKKYEITVNFHRDDLDNPFSIKNIGKVNCTCNAYRYNVSHPNRKNDAQSDPIPGFSSIPNKVRNPKMNSSVCKHLYSFLIFLYNKHIIKNN